jgi:uncharacterized OB-fold protein
MTDLLKPGLYREAAAGPPVLLGGKCPCGHVFFPMQAYGCEVCGRQDLTPRTLVGAGRLIASARVHLFAGKGREAPFTVASIQLDDGPVVRTLIVEEASSLAPGQRMAARLVPVAGPEGEPRLDLRFAPEA